MRVTPVESLLVFLASLALLQTSEPIHLRDSMENSLSYSADAIRINIKCKICGPRGLFLVWRKTCFKIRTNERVKALNNNTKIILKQVFDADSPCNMTADGGKVETLISVYKDILPGDDINCKMTCCGYSWGYKREAAVPNSPNSSRESTTVGATTPGLLPDDVIWSSAMRSQSQVDMIDSDGECKMVTTERIVALARDRTLYIEVVVYLMAVLSLLSVVATFICVCLHDQKSNREKRFRFRRWIQHEKSRQSTISQAGSSKSARSSVPENLVSSQPCPPGVDNFSLAKLKVTEQFEMVQLATVQFAEMVQLAAGRYGPRSSSDDSLHHPTPIDSESFEMAQVSADRSRSLPLGASAESLRRATSRVPVQFAQSAQFAEGSRHSSVNSQGSSSV